jgi:hypothetical protein
MKQKQTEEIAVTAKKVKVAAKKVEIIGVSFCGGQVIPV